ncbi:carbohydrate esterase family 4 protein [Favolaschia claudopus]|uniref:chitin deacetylase n=1 Tax=Favolaschia claudopus TaxID=2862362 RepID=A0AAW0CZD4_9AGAR
MVFLATLLALPLLSYASVYPRHDDHPHTDSNPLPSTWYHDSNHPVHALFRRGDNSDGSNYAAVGSQEWSNGFPPPWPTNGIDTNSIPSKWVDALNDAISRKAVPDIPVPTMGKDGNPAYPNGGDPNSPEICSATYQCRIDGDVWDGPAGTVALSFDDGPEAGTNQLLSFLASKNQKSTHFLIGSNILYNADSLKKMFDQGDDLAVHTWTHQYTTTLSNLQVVAELGFTMQLIHNSTGGRIPKFWRPPYGDTDKRVSAIAKEVFGLTTVIWNQNTADYTLTETPPYTTPEKIQSDMKKWMTGPKSPGLVILEHELTKECVDAFTAAYPLMEENNWNVVSLASLLGGNVTYQNAASNTSPVSLNDLVNAKNGPQPNANGVAANPSGSTVGAGASQSQKPSGPSSAGSPPVSAPSNTPSGTSSASGPLATTISSWPSILLAVAVTMLWT